MNFLISFNRSGVVLTIKLEPSAITRSVFSSIGLINGCISDAGRLNKGITSIIVSAANEMLLSRAMRINDKSFLFKVNLLGSLFQQVSQKRRQRSECSRIMQIIIGGHKKHVHILQLTLLSPTIINFGIITFPTQALGSSFRG